MVCFLVLVFVVLLFLICEGKGVMKMQAVTHGKNLSCCLGIVNSDWELIPAAGGGVYIGVVVQPGNFIHYCQKN